ncbi:MAG: aldo/keto reductase [bacterium]|nr:aldo/keto reductase [bacterium]
MKNISRRQFLQRGSAGVSVLSVNPLLLSENQTVKPEIKYITLGRTGFKASNIGYGTSRGSIDPSVINYAINKGINYIDSSEGYGKGQGEVNIGKAVRKQREKVFISTKVGSVNDAGRLTKDTTKQQFLDRAAACLERLDTPYIDALLMHGAGDPDFGGFDNPQIDEAVRQLKSEGKIRYYGFSTHNYNLIEAVKKAADSNKVDVMLLAYNFYQKEFPEGYQAPADWLKEFNDVLKVAKSKNIGITAMKILQGAQGAEVVDKGVDPKLAKQAAAKWSLNSPNVDVAVLSLASVSEINDFAQISNSTFDKDDLAVLEVLGNNRTSFCRIGCPAPCISACPENVPVPDILRINMYFTVYGWEKQAMTEYNNLSRSKNLTGCRNCTKNFCTQSCTYGVNTKRMLSEAQNNLNL